jgi:hypothetical protein
LRPNLRNQEVYPRFGKVFLFWYQGQNHLYTQKRLQTADPIIVAASVNHIPSEDPRQAAEKARASQRIPPKVEIFFSVLAVVNCWAIRYPSRLMGLRSLLLYVLSVGTAIQLHAQNADKQLLGVSLGPTAQTLLQTVEEQYGKPVNAVLDSDLPMEYEGRAVVDDDGNPTIKINPATGRNEAGIVHELMHLWWYAQGAPWIDLYPAPTRKSYGQLPPELFTFLQDRLYDELTHAAIYPKMREIGIDPTQDERVSFRKVMADDSTLLLEGAQIVQSTLTVESSALDYFRAAYILQDSDLAEELAFVYTWAGIPGAVSKGKAMVTAVRAHDLSKPNELVPAFIDLANKLFAGEYDFIVGQQYTHKKGRLNAQTARIYILPSSIKNDCDYVLCL